MAAAISSSIQRFPNEILIPRNTECEDTYKFKTGDGDDRQSLYLKKKETTERTYQLNICYFGRIQGVTGWGIKINGQVPTVNTGEPFMYYNSRSFKICPTSFFNLEIEETDDKNTEKLWIDLSDTQYAVHRAPVSIDEKIYRLIIKGLQLHSQDEKLVDAIFHNNDIVILYTLQNEHKYFSIARKEDEDFANTASAQIKTIADPGTNWTLKLSQDGSSHTFFYSYMDEFDPSTTKASWDTIKLKTIIPHHLNKISAPAPLPCFLPPLNIMLVIDYPSKGTSLETNG